MTFHRQILTLQMVLCTCCALCPAAPASEATSSLWRGDQTGHLPSEPAVTSGDAGAGTNLLWRRDLPARGHSAVVVAGGSVILTCEPDHVLALDANTGEVRWHTRCQSWVGKLMGVAPEQVAAFNAEYAEILRLAATAQGNCPESSEREKRSKELRNRLKLRRDPPNQGDYSGSCPTPAVCDDTVVVRFGAGVLAGLSLADGTIRWELAESGLGHLDSPIQVGKSVALLEERKEGAAISTFDAATGRPGYKTILGNFDFHHQHATLTACTIGGRTVLLSQNGCAVDALSGAVLGSGLFGGSFEVVPAGELLLVATSNGYKPDQSSVTAYRPQLAGDQLTLEKVWRLTGKDWTCSATPVSDGTHVYLPNGRHRISVVTLAAGKDVTVGKPPYRASGHAWTPPLLTTGELLVCATAAGPVAFHRLGPALELAGTIALPAAGKKKDGAGHPAILNGRIYVRDHGTAFCFGGR